MPSDPSTGTAALAVTALYVVVVLLVGYFVVQQWLLSALVALLGVFAYLAWRYLWLPGRDGGQNPT
jgi:hypothetical protein